VVNGKSACRCRHGHTTASRPSQSRAKNAYIREDRILSRLPLVLLHGGLMTIRLNFGIALPALAEHHRRIAIELQGHSHTAGVDRPPTFPDFATDVIALLDHLEVERADVAGFSVGELTGYELVISYPDRVRRAVVASVNHRCVRRRRSEDECRAGGHYAHGFHPQHPAGACDRGVPRLTQHRADDHLRCQDGER